MGIIKRNMENIRNIVIISNKDGVCSTQIEPIRSSQPMEMGLISITHGPVANVTDDNSLVLFSLKISDIQTRGILKPFEKSEISHTIVDDGNREDIDEPVMDEVVEAEETSELSSRDLVTLGAFIPTGSYLNAFDLLKAIELAIKKRLVGVFINPRDIDKAIEIVVYLGVNNTPKLRVNTRLIIIKDFDHRTPWPLIHVNNSDDDKIKGIDAYNILGASDIGFVYANIVENCYVNGRLSRFLNIIPLKKGQSYLHYEYNNPNYVPICVKDFNSINIEIADLNGNLLKFPAGFKTIICLKIRPINTSSIPLK